MLVLSPKGTVLVHVLEDEDPLVRIVALLAKMTTRPMPVREEVEYEYDEDGGRQPLASGNG